MRREMAIRCQVVFRHSARREPLLEASVHRGAVQTVETTDGSVRGRESTAHTAAITPTTATRLVTRVDAASDPSRIDADQVRGARFEGERMVLFLRLAGPMGVRNIARSLGSASRRNNYDPV